MPRRNNRKTYNRTHGATLYDDDFKVECYGCAFAGKGFKCLVGDGKCLINKPDRRERDNVPDTDGTS